MHFLSILLFWLDQSDQKNAILTRNKLVLDFKLFCLFHLIATLLVNQNRFLCSCETLPDITTVSPKASINQNNRLIRQIDWNIIFTRSADKQYKLRILINNLKTSAQTEWMHISYANTTPNFSQFFLIYIGTPRCNNLDK